MRWQDYISIDPKVCHGKACIRGRRVMVSVVLDNIAEGRSTPQILEDYPTLNEGAIEAAIRYAAELARERVIRFEPEAA